MVDKEQLKNGLLSYLDNEVIPCLPSTGKWGLGTVIVLISSKYEKVFNEIRNNSIVKAVGVIDDNGMVDINAIAAALKETAQRYGKLTITIPIVGILSFTETDVDKLLSYINGGGTA